ncbi:MAG: hypothetical protein ACI865_001176 [Flavobacteriaceae bacterium]|jgi:hypothetical protein
MKKSFLLFPAIACAFSTNAQNVNIPDLTFKNLLLQNTSINLNWDSEIQLSEANTYTGILDVSHTLVISDMTGLEEFTQISELNCSANFLTELDVTANSLLTVLTCYGNYITTLTLGGNLNLTVISASSNLLTDLDLSIYPNLTFVNISDTPMTSLNLANGNNTNMTFWAVAAPNLQCVQVDDPLFSAANWSNIEPGLTFSLDCFETISINELSNNPKEVIQILDFMGREVEFKSNTPLIFIYSDGSQERKMGIQN